MDQGLARRFKETVEFDDITAEEATQMLMSKVVKEGYHLYANGQKDIFQLFQDLAKRENWSNIADVYTVFEELYRAAATRLAQPIKDALEKNTLTALSIEDNAKL
jgi:hypothetical protein